MKSLFCMHNHLESTISKYISTYSKSIDVFKVYLSKLNEYFQFHSVGCAQKPKIVRIHRHIKFVLFSVHRIRLKIPFEF